MTSQVKTSRIESVADDEETQTYSLPPVLCSNPRRKIEARQILVAAIKVQERRHEDPRRQLVPYPVVLPSLPIVKYPLILSWAPESIEFDLYEEPLETEIRLCNPNERPIYVKCCGLIGERSRLGASWWTYPRTRFWLPPGFRVKIHVRAMPRSSSPIPQALSALQIAASHLRDNVVGYFEVPIKVNFSNYVHVALGQEE